MYYRALLFITPIPLIVFIWNSGNVDLSTEAKTLFTVIFALLVAGGFIDIFRSTVEGDME